MNPNQILTNEQHDSPLHLIEIAEKVQTILSVLYYQQDKASKRLTDLIN